MSGEPPDLERVDQQVVGVVGRAAGDVDLADREVEQVPDEEQQDASARPSASSARRTSTSGCASRRSGWCAPSRPGATAPRRRSTCTTRAPIRTTRIDPQHALVRELRLADGAQVLGVLVVGVVAAERLEVAVHVHQHERDEDDAAGRHEQLQRDRRSGRSRAGDETGRLTRTGTRGRHLRRLSRAAAGRALPTARVSAFQPRCDISRVPRVEPVPLRRGSVQTARLAGAGGAAEVAHGVDGRA